MALPTVGGLLCLSTSRQSATIFTGVDTGDVTVEVFQHQTAPPIHDEATWEDIAWITLDVPSGTMFATGVYGDGTTENISPGAGLLLIRCSAKGRDAAPGAFLEGDSAEIYRLDVWPVGIGDDPQQGVIKATSETSRNVQEYTEGESSQE